MYETMNPKKTSHISSETLLDQMVDDFRAFISADSGSMTWESPPYYGDDVQGLETSWRVKVSIERAKA